MAVIPVAHRLCTIPIVAAGGIGTGAAWRAPSPSAPRACSAAPPSSWPTSATLRQRVQGRHCRCAGERHAGLPRSRHGAQRAHRRPPPWWKSYFEVLKEEGYDKAELLMGGGIAHAMKDGGPRAVHLYGRPVGRLGGAARHLPGNHREDDAGGPRGGAGAGGKVALTRLRH